MNGLQLDRKLVDAFVNGRLDQAGEAMLAEQVARIIPFHWTLPNPMAAEMSRVRDRMGGEPAVFAWLERHPGRPRLVARLYLLIGLLDQLTDEPAVLTALGELRTRTSNPPGLEGHLVPDTSRETLSSLAQEVEMLLADDRGDEALRLADATAAMLEQVAPRIAELDSNLRDVGDTVAQLRQDVRAATHSD